MANENSPRYQKQNDKMHLRKQNHPIRCRRTVGHAKSERNRRHKIAFIFIDSILMCAKRDSSVRDRVSTQCDVFFFLYASMCALRIDTEKIRSERQARSLCIQFFYDVRPYVMMLQSEGERVPWGGKRSNRLKLK